MTTRKQVLMILICVFYSQLSSKNMQTLTEKSYFSVNLSIQTSEEFDEIARIYKGTILETQDGQTDVQTFVVCGVDADQKKGIGGGIVGPVKDSRGSLYWSINRSYYRNRGMRNVTINIIALCDNQELKAPTKNTVYVLTSMIDQRHRHCDQGVQWGINKQEAKYLCFGKEARGSGKTYQLALENAILKIFEDLEQDKAISIAKEEIEQYVDLEGNLREKKFIIISCYEANDCKLEINNFSDKESDDDMIRVSFSYDFYIIKDDLISKFQSNWVDNG